jgi:hypothetical protein
MLTMDISDAASKRWAKVLGHAFREVTLFAHALGNRQDRSTDLFVIGAPEFEPWHFCAHLGEQASRFGRPDLSPTWLRWSVPLGAPAHLARSVDTLNSVSRRQTVLIVDPLGGTPELMERVAGARHHGARIMSLHRGHQDLVELSHETLLIDRLRPDRDFEIAQHLVTDLAPIPARGNSSRARLVSVT